MRTNSQVPLLSGKKVIGKISSTLTVDKIFFRQCSLIEIFSKHISNLLMRLLNGYATVSSCRLPNDGQNLCKWDFHVYSQRIHMMAFFESRLLHITRKLELKSSHMYVALIRSFRFSVIYNNT